MDWRGLQQELHSGKRNQLYLLYGEDEWQVSQAIQALIQLIPASLRSLNLTRVAGKNLKPADMDQYLQGSLFGDERILVIEEPRFLRTARRGEDAESGKKDAGDETAWQSALEMLQQELLVVLIHPGTIDRRRKITKWLEKQATLVECAPLKRGEMLGLIQAQLRAVGLETEYGVPERLQEIAGDAPGIAMQEITKLRTAYPDKRRLSMQDVLPILSASVDAEVFTLFDLLAELRLEEVFDLLDELLHRGEAAPRIIAAIARQLRQMLQVRALTHKGIRGETAARQLGLHAFYVQRLAEKAAQYSDEQLVSLLASCCTTDSKMKSGRLSMEAGVDLLLLQMASALKPRRLRK